VAELLGVEWALDDAERAERVTHLRRLAGYAAKKAAPSSEDSNSPALECAPGDAGDPCLTPLPEMVARGVWSRWHGISSDGQDGGAGGNGHSHRGSEW